MNNVGRDIHVLVVDDSAVVRQVMSAILSQEPDIAVTVAANAHIAMHRIAQHRPDAIVLDIEMPGMDGLSFLRKLMDSDRIPVVICSAVAGTGTRAALQALELGAVSIVSKPRLGVREFLHDSAVTMMDAVRAAAHARPRVAHARPPMRPLTATSPVWRTRSCAEKVVAIGASTGGTEALIQVLQPLTCGCPGIVVVQHMPEVFTRSFAERLNEICEIEVKEARPGERLCAGTALIAPGNRHMALRRAGDHFIVDVFDGELVRRHRPSVDVLFSSVAQAAGRNACGVIMTGMGDDGARGLLAMRQAGAFTVAQDEASCVVFGMPKEAVALGATNTTLPLTHICGKISAWARTEVQVNRAVPARNLF